MASVGPVYEECRKSLEKLAAWYDAHPGDRNEATTRLQLVDRLFFDCLGWDRSDGIRLEDEEDGEYSDYLFSTTKDVLIVEAKREGKAFEVPAGCTRQRYAIGSLMRDYPPLKKAIKQVANYCWERGVPYAAVCNGHQVVAFVASRSDGVRPLEGQALVFPSLAYMAEKFHDLWQALSKPGIVENRLYARLVADGAPELPPKLSSQIDGYPGRKERNVFQTDLMNLTELIVEDVVRSPEIERRFLEECYCSSDALSQHSKLSRDILAARYSALFDSENPGPVTMPVRTRHGITQELLAESLSRRPILLLGDVGVGKTSFQRHLILIDAKDVLGDSITLYVNLGTKGTLSLDLRAFVIEELERQLLDEHRIHIRDAMFSRGVYERELKLHEKETYGDASTIDPAERDRKRDAFLDEKRSNRSEHLRRSIQHLSKARKKQIVIFLDNTDQRDGKDQEQAFLIAQEFAETWGAAVYLPIRPSTFHYSKKFGALSGYHAKAFTISPPRVDVVVKRRLRFAQKFTKGEIPLLLGAGKQLDIRMTVLDTLIEVFLDSLDGNRDLLEILDNVSDGNIRMALDLVKQFFGSGHVDTKKIYEKALNPDYYTIPSHEFLRAVIFGDTAYFDPSSSPVANLFDLKWSDPKEHFLLPLLVGVVDQSRSMATAQGFVEIRLVYQRLQGCGFAPDQIDHAISRALSKKLLESPARRVPKHGQDAPKYIRSTAFGLYHAFCLCSRFAYMDAVVVDIPVLDPKIRREIRVVDQGLLSDRLARVNALKGYLDECWGAIPAGIAGFDWPKASDALLTDMTRVMASNEKQQHRRRTDRE